MNICQYIFDAIIRRMFKRNPVFAYLENVTCILFLRENICHKTHVHIVGHISHNEDKFWSPHLYRDICEYNNYVSMNIIELYYTDLVYVSL